MKKYLLFLLLFSSVVGQAQIILKGRVIDENTKETLPGVSVYLNNTTIGTVTNSEGRFALNISLSGKIEVVASYLGYEKKAIVLADYRDSNLTIALKAQSNSLNEVIVKAQKADGFEKWGTLFNKMLLSNGHGGNTKIQNPDVLVFYFDQAQNQLRVFARKPLLIQNMELGYLLRLDLDEFTYDFSTDLLQAKYYTLFEENHAAKTNREEVLWRRNLAYYGSQMHFMRSVYANTLSINGFKVYRYRAVANKEKERVTKIVQQRINSDARLKSSATYNLAKLFTSRDTVQYYNMILAQSDALSADTVLTSIRKYAQLNRVQDVVVFNATDSLMITYTPKLDRYNNTVFKPLAHPQLHVSEANNSKSKNTVIYFKEKGGISIQRSGYYPEFKLYYQGDMFERRIAQSLPWDYDPDAK